MNSDASSIDETTAGLLMDKWWAFLQILYLITDGKLRGRLLSNEHRFYHIRMTLPLLFPTVIDELLAQDLLDDEEEVEV